MYAIVLRHNRAEQGFSPSDVNLLIGVSGQEEVCLFPFRSSPSPRTTSSWFSKEFLFVGSKTTMQTGMTFCRCVHRKGLSYHERSVSPSPEKEPFQRSAEPPSCAKKEIHKNEVSWVSFSGGVLSHSPLSCLWFLVPIYLSYISEFLKEKNERTKLSILLQS